ncbi:phosphate acyltransferase PlsX [Candidatus Poribacteria bacterium]|nr:phosphate acyltransferase PlsX [Candidatus Poribacteria bacterium]
MRIAVDAMGGDYAPDAVIEGAVLAARENQLEILLVGPQDVIEERLKNYDLENSKIEIIPASQVVQMDEPAADAIRHKRDSSIAISARLLKNKEADAMISAGNTAAVYATARLFLGKLKGVSRPALAMVFPNVIDSTIVIDVGANAGGCRAEDLLHFALMGEIYAREIIGKENPRVGLLSVGEEKSKGSALTLEAYSLMEDYPINFIGNIEGSDVVSGKTDVLVCDGFVGNVILKLVEGMGEVIYKLVKEEISQSFLAKIGFLLASPTLRKLGKKIDYEEYGGAPLLGINGVCLIGHGKSSPNAIKSAIRAASESVSHKVNERIEQSLQNIKQGN